MKAAGLERRNLLGAALVLDGHSRAALETLQALGRLGIAVDLASEGDCLGRQSRYCRRRLHQPSSNDGPAFLAWLEGLFNTNGYALIVPSTESSLRGLLLAPESDALRCAAVLPSNRSLEVALSKQRTWELARTLDVPVPGSRYILSPDDAVEPKSFPLVLKPATSLVKIEGQLVGVVPTIVTTRLEWLRTLERMLSMCPVLEQEYFPGRGVGIECLYRHGTRCWYFQHERLHELPLTGGGSSYRRSSPVDDGLLNAATALLDSLDWHGVAMVEFRGSAATGYRLMEINPRLWGSLALPIDAGVDFPKGLWFLAKGVDPGPQPPYAFPYYTRNLRMDFDWFKENLRADHADPLLLTMPSVRSLLEYGRPLLRKESWDHFDARDWRVWSSVLYTTLDAAWGTARSLIKRAARRYLIARRHARVLFRLGSNSTTPVRRILFVCYGNICRSPLAELHARALLPDLEVASAGFHGTVGRLAPAWYRGIAADLGVDLSSCRSRRIDSAQVQWAQLILLSDLDNLDRFEREFPGAIAKTTMLGFFLPKPRPSIEDPYNLDAGGARAAVTEVLAAVEHLVVWTRTQANHTELLTVQGSDAGGDGHANHIQSNMRR